MTKRYEQDVACDYVGVEGEAGDVEGVEGGGREKRWWSIGKVEGMMYGWVKSKWDNKMREWKGRNREEGGGDGVCMDKRGKLEEMEENNGVVEGWKDG